MSGIAVWRRGWRVRATFRPRLGGVVRAFVASGDPMTWFYIAACVLVPALWGAVSAWLFSGLDRRRREKQRERPPIDYMI